MNQFRQPLLTLFVIFFAAYLLTIIGCAPSSGGGGGAGAETPSAPLQPVQDEAVLQPLPLNDLRECTDTEFSALVAWSNQLKAGNDTIQSLGPKSNWKKNSPANSVIIKSMNQCDQVEYYHSLKPCKKTKTQRDVTTPDKITKTVIGYDAYRINERCQKIENYLNHLGLRPDPNAVVNPEPQPVDPPAVDDGSDDNGLRPLPPTPPVVGQPPVVQPPVQPPQQGGLRQCTNDEFSKLVTWRSNLDRANKNIAKLGSSSQWKFDTLAIDAATAAAKTCEQAIDYHSQQPCQREKVYSAESIKSQCETARTYFYNFAQKSENLIVNRARLMLNTQPFSGQRFAPGLSNTTYGQCVLSNVSSTDIIYSGQKVLVKEARVYPAVDLQMFVLVTTEGLKLECYGLQYSSAATSLTEVVRLLKARQSPLGLSYEIF